jgi:hypothetical protein
MVAAIYQWIKAESDAELYRLQAEAAQRLVPSIESLPSAPKAQ